MNELTNGETHTNSKSATKTTKGKKLPTYQCCKCGKEFHAYAGNFYKSAATDIFTMREGYGVICSKCIEERFNSLKEKYGSERFACIGICYIMDWYYDVAAYNKILEKNGQFSIGHYVRLLNTRAYLGKNFMNSIVEKKLGQSQVQVWQQNENTWSEVEQANRDMVLEVYGYDPFPIGDFSEKSRKYLFNSIVDFLDEDTQEDAFKKSQIVQIVINNEIIQRCNTQMAKLDPMNEGREFKDLSEIVTKKVNDNDKIAKENEISVRNRSDKKIGKGTFTELQRDLRLKNFDEAEANYYSQLQSDASMWATEQSMKAIRRNCFFDEHDQNDILNTQRQLIIDKDKELDDSLEQNRLLNVEVADLKKEIQELQVEINKLYEEDIQKQENAQENKEGDLQAEAGEDVVDGEN